MATGIFVIETENDILLGTVEFAKGGKVIVRNGFVGRPRIIQVHEILELTPAENHPLLDSYTLVS